MARKNKSPKAPKVKKERKKLSLKWFDKNVYNALVATVLVICVFAAGNFTGRLLSVKDSIEEAKADVTASTAAPVTTTAPTAAATTQPTTAATTKADTETTFPFASAPVITEAGANSSSSSSDTTAASAAQGDTSSNAGAAVQSTDEVLALFNKAADNVKVNATSVTRNFVKQQHLSEYTELPSLLQSMGSSIISSVLKDSYEVKVYDTKEKIIEKFPVGEETWSSKATAADVKEATCTDDGTNYNITIKYIDGTDPVGSGVANSFSLMKVEYVTEAAGNIVTGASFSYLDAVITAKIDKATGNLVWANYHLPMKCSVDTKIASGVVGLLIEEDYTIAY